MGPRSLGPFFSGESIMTKTLMRIDKPSTPLPQLGFFARKNWWLFTLRGVFAILFGLIALIFPSPTMLSLVLLFSAYMLVDGMLASFLQFGRCVEGTSGDCSCSKAFLISW